MQATESALARRVGPAALLLAAVAIVLSVLAGSAAASTAYSAASAQPRPIPSTGWNGRPIKQPHKPVSAGLLEKASFPKSWSAGPVRYGTGYHRPQGSQRVREVQRRLTRLGYHTGPIDGLYGPLTRSAVQWFQIKHGLRPTGVVAATTLTALRDPEGFAQDLGARAKSPKTAAPRPESPQPARGTPQAPPQPAQPAASHDKTPGWLVPALIAALAVLLGLALLSLRAAARRSRRRGRAMRPTAPQLGPRTERPAGSPPVVLGYVSGESLEAVAPHETAIRTACAQRGWTLARLVRENRRGGRALSRPGLAYALEELSSGAASRLVVHRLEHLAHSVKELRAVLAWFMRTGIALTALDVQLDTATPEGRTALRTLLSVAGSEEARTRARTRNGLSAANTRGRPAVKDQPELAERIREMRAGGMTLQAIADSLNAEGVPTVRGGSQWRPSSVQSVLGYKRSVAR